jgi:hypothetical protein
MKISILCYTLVLLFMASVGWTATLLIIADEQAPMRELTTYLTAQGHQVTLVDQPQCPDDMTPYHAVFNYIHSTMDEKVAHSQIRYATRGGRLILLHHAVASARWKNPAFLAAIGIHLNPRDHPATPWKVLANVTHTVVNLNPHHFITSHNMRYPKTESYQCAGTLTTTETYPAFDLENTEVFLNQHFTDGYEKTVLFGVKTTDPETGTVIMQDRAGWLKAAGKGWIIYFQPGHSITDFQNANFLQIIQNAVIWQP